MQCLGKVSARSQELFSSAHSRASALVAHLEHASVLAAVRDASITVDDAEAQNRLDLAIERSIAGYMKGCTSAEELVLEGLKEYSFYVPMRRLEPAKSL
jgi:hypothetical protein